jgi:hypothetical protein
VTRRLAGGLDCAVQWHRLVHARAIAVPGCNSMRAVRDRVGRTGEATRVD